MSLGTRSTNPQQPPADQGWPASQQQPNPVGYGQPPPSAWLPPSGTAGPGGPGGGMGFNGTPQEQAKGFFGALFDFGFNSFATPAVVKILYIVGMVLLGLFYIVIIFAGFNLSAVTGLIAFVGGGIAVLFYLTLFRITLEFYYAVVRMSEDIHHRR